MIKFTNPAATATLIVQEEDKILLVKRKHEPYKGMWALPGGFLNYKRETLEETAVRELKEETGLIAKIEDLKLLRVYSEPDRDPRDHVIDHVYIVRRHTGEAKAADDAESLAWFPLYNLPAIAFDHLRAIKDYMREGYHYTDHKM